MDTLKNAVEKGAACASLPAKFGIETPSQMLTGNKAAVRVYFDPTKFYRFFGEVYAEFVEGEVKFGYCLYTKVGDGIDVNRIDDFDSALKALIEAYLSKNKDTTE